MFTIKVTYRDQTRRATLQDHSSFPSYFEICAQVYRLFPITHGFTLSKLLFSQDASSSSCNILISKEVCSANDYTKAIRPYKGVKWPNALLKFTILDFDSVPRSFGGEGSFGICESHNSAFAMEVDQTPTAAASVRHSGVPLQHLSSMTSVSSCCSVAESKAEVKALLDDFQVGLNRVLVSNLQEPLVVSRQNSEDTLNSAQTTNNPRAPPTQCSHCNSHIVSTAIWYSCVDCRAIVCKPCRQRGTTGFCLNSLGPHTLVVKSHAARRLPSPWTLPLSPSPHSFLPTAGPRNNESFETHSGTPRPVIHAGVVCDACNKTIHGVRHKCLDCSDYDLCTRCITTGSAERHNPFHEFFEIREPGRVVVHEVVSGQPEVLARPERSDESTTRAPPVVHTANCDLCDSRITGDRYKCAICPDFDTCSSCFVITDVQHPNHSFVKISKREDLIHRHILQRPLHYATCDGCHKTISGPRFKCMHPDCPDYDLCENCEALPIAVHPSNHPLLKMKTPDTVLPAAYGSGRPNRYAFGSITPTPEPRTTETPVRTRDGTPTPASETANNLMSSTNNHPSIVGINAPKVTSANPFADIFSVETGTPAHPPSYATPNGDSGAPAGGISPCPTMTDTEAIRRLVAAFSKPGHQSPERYKFDEAKEDSQIGLTERNISVDRPFDSEEPLHSSIPVPGGLPGVGYDESPAPMETVSNPATIESVFNALPELERQPTEILVSPESDSQKDNSMPGVEPFAVRESLASLIRELPTLVPAHDPPSEAQSTAPRISLSAAFVEDVTVLDGQVFPPGAEFVKCWRLINDSGCEWPESTELVFLAGDSLSAAASDGKGIVVPVGRTGPGETIDVWTGELKAPEVAGRYVGYWRLKANGESFGNSLWVDINVVEADSHHSSEDSMASSSVIMPAASSAPQSERVPSVTVATLSTNTHSLASTDDNISEADSDMSLISMPASPSDDEVWHETRSRLSSNVSGARTTGATASAASSTPAAMGMDYVILYDDSDDEKK